jgi:hypothetical protein
MGYIPLLKSLLSEKGVLPSPSQEMNLQHNFTGEDTVEGSSAGELGFVVAMRAKTAQLQALCISAKMGCSR